MTRKILMTDELFQEIGAAFVEWGKPDADGFYSPIVYRNAIREHEVAAIENQAAHRTIARIRQAWKDYGIKPVGRIARGINEVEMILE